MSSPSLQTPWRNSYRLSVAPMMDWTDRHCRFFHRLLAPHSLLYTEMITTGAILHGDLHRLLDFDSVEHPVALQIGGSEPQDLARAAKIGADWGYDEINLNCGCPSERVQKGAFGACLMKEPALVADGIKAMQDAVSVPVTVKHRIGVDDQNDYSFVRDFVGHLYAIGCRVFIVHARGAILKGLSPKENREIPPLKWSVVRALKADFPGAIVVANGGIAEIDQAEAFLKDSDEGPAVDGVMLGRAAYHDPWLLRELDARWFADGPRASKRPDRREDVIAALDAYLIQKTGPTQSAKSMARHWHGLFHGQPGARAWRRAMCEGQSPLVQSLASVWRRDPAAAV